MKNRIHYRDLVAGDVLLYHGNALVSRLIQRLDGTEYHHAAIFDGNELVEASQIEGIGVSSVEESCADAEFVHVYRFASTDGRTVFGRSELPVEPLVGRIRHYADRRDRFGYDQSVLLALLISTRQYRHSGAAWIMRYALDEATIALARLATQNRQPMICSELVYRYFTEACERDTYRLRITKAVDRAHIASAPWENCSFEASQLQGPMQDQENDMALCDEMAAFLEHYIAAKHGGSTPFSDSEFTESMMPDFVTPGDLKRSPNLVFAGSLALT